MATCYGFALFTQADGSAVIDAGWNFDYDSLGFTFCAPAVTNGAFFLGYLTFAAALWADRSLLDVAKNSFCNPGKSNY